MKQPLRYQITEYDCGPTSLLNAVSFLFNLMNLGYGGAIGPQMEHMFSSSAAETASGTLTLISSLFWHMIIIEAIQSAILYIATVLGLKRGLNLG